MQVGRESGREGLRLSLVIPSYNEAAGLPGLVARCREVIAASPTTEVIIVNNGSTDNSAAVLAEHLQDEPAIRSLLVPVNKGYGFGVLSGVRAARGDVIAWTHADLQTDPMDAVRGMDWFNDAQDPQNLFVKGRRAGRPASDRIFTVGMSVFESALFATPLSDINAVPTMFHRSFCADWTFEGWTHPPHDFSLDLFAYVLARRRRMQVRRLGVDFGARRHGQSSWNANTWSSKQKFIARTWDYSLRLRRQLLEARGKR